jgi:poly(A) polymerase
MSTVLAPRSRLEGGWLEAASLRKVFAAVRNAGSEARVVGGAVRDALLGRPNVGDIDLATPLPPDAVTKAARAAGLDAYPTGISHGTVTVVADGHPFQITTLRRDVETDGRHAVIDYTRSWEEDALRRDFTINALYCAEDGAISDFTGGLDDLHHGRVQFIGDARTRIREDYLRILRFFRFSSAYANGHIDAEGLAASIAEREGIARLSAERVREELLKTLASSKAADVVDIMHSNGLLDAFLCPAFPPRLRRFSAIEAFLGSPPDAIGRLAALALENKGDAALIGERLRLSTAEAAKLATAFTNIEQTGIEAPLNVSKMYIYRHGSEAYRRAVKSCWARSNAATTDPAWKAKFLLADRFRAPRMPFTGADVVGLGIPPGPRVGKVLAAFESWWINEDFPDGEERLRARLRELAAHA